MVRLDLKDKRILTVLDENARTPLSKIASRVGLSKQVVDYRIKSLIKRGIINGFTIRCDLTKFGYSTYGVYLRLRNLTEQKENEIIDLLVNHPSTKWVIVCEGRWDIAFSLSATGIIDFNLKFSQILEKLGNNVERYDTNIILKLRDFYINLIEEKNIFRIKPTYHEFSSQKEVEEIDSIDVRILQELQANSRASLVSIARKLNVSSDVVRYRLKRLKDRKIILEFRTRLGYKKLGYNWYQLLIDLRRFPEAEEKKFFGIVQTIPNITYLVKCMGKWDLEIHIRAQSNEEFRKILKKIRNALSDFIVSYDTMIIFKRYKSRALPRGVAKELIKGTKRK